MSAIPCQLFGSWSTPFDEPFALRKTLFVPGIHVAVSDAEVLRPFFQAFGDTINFNFDGAFPVVALVLHRGPSTIISRISKVVINSLNRHAIRACPHVIVKTFKNLPFIAQVYAATAVAFKKCTSRICASGFYVDPDAIGSGSIVPMLKKTVIVFLFQTATGPFVPGCKSMRTGDGCAAAFTLTEPSGMIFPDESLSPDNC